MKLSVLLISAAMAGAAEALSSKGVVIADEFPGRLGVNGPPGEKGENGILPLKAAPLDPVSYLPAPVSYFPDFPKRRWKHNGWTEEAFGGPPKKRRKDAFLASSCAEAKRIARERRHKQELAKWFASLSAADQAIAREQGLHEHLPTGITFGPVGGTTESADGREFHDSSDSPAASVNVHPVDAMEPQGSGVEIPQLSDEEITAASQTFSWALRWALDGADLVEMGARSAVMVASLRPDLATGLPLDEELRDRFFKRVNGDYLATGLVFGRALEWARRGSALSVLGERLYLMAYVLRPQLINAMTLARIGQLTNKTRQAKDRLANDLRDVFAGLKARTMRSDTTRKKCRRAQMKAVNLEPPKPLTLYLDLESGVEVRPADMSGMSGITLTRA